MDNTKIGNIQSDAGLRFESSGGQKFYVNYRGRNDGQGTSITSKGRAALGMAFKWGGAPNRGIGFINLNNSMGIMATEDNTVVNIFGYNPNCTFGQGTNPNAITADNISVKLRFTPSLRHRNGTVVEDIKPAGGIRVSFSNGDSQELELEAVLHHPEVQLSAPAGGVLDFGTLHVECERTLLCTVTNVSHCDAAVSFSHVKKVFQASSLSKGDEEDELEAASEVLLCSALVAVFLQSHLS
jgi:hypothetical protein